MALLSGFDQLNSTSDTFSDWLNKTNELILMTRGDTTGAQTSIMTANGLPGGSMTYGNATLFGQLAANGVVVFNEGQSPSSNAYANGYYGGLRGGTWNAGTNNFTTDTLYITSNTTYTAEGVEVYVESTYGLIVENNIEARDDVLFVGTGGSNTDPKMHWIDSTNILNLNDSVKATFGTSDDLQIYHDGTHSFISDASGTGNIYVLSNLLSIRNAANNEVMFTATENGAIQLYYDNTQRLTTTSIGVEIEGEANTDTLRAQSTTYLESDVYFGTKASTATADITWNTTTNILNFNDSITATFGDSDDLSIKHDGTNSIIENNTGTLVLQSNNITLRTDQGVTETMLTAAVDGAVTLYFDNSVKFATTTTGATLTGTLIADGVTVGNNEIIQVGSNMQMYSTGTISYIVETGTGNLILQGNNTLLQSTTGETYFQGVADGAASLYFNNVVKLATLVGGVDVTGNLVSDGIVSDGNALLNRDVDLGSGTSNTISFIGRVDTAITPSANNTLDLGTNLLRWNDGYFGGLLTTDLLTCESNATFQESIFAIGGVTAATFSGGGSALTSLNATNISSGTIGDAYLPATITSDITGTATKANTVYITTNATNNNFKIPYISDVVGDYETLYGDSSFFYNPFSQELSIKNLTVTDSVALPAAITFSNTTTFENIYVSNTAFIYSLEITSLEANGVALTGSGGDVTLASTDTVIDSFDKGQTQGFKYLVHGENLGNADSGYIVEINVIVTDNGAIYYTRYGEVDNSMGTVSITPVVNTVPLIDQIQLVANCSAAGPANTHRFKVMKIETRT